MDFLQVASFYLWEVTMGRVAMNLAKREAKAAEDAVRAHRLPQGIRGFSVEPGMDEDGDPVMWVWFDAEDPNRPDP